jgi:hypothetical protein
MKIALAALTLFVALRGYAADAVYLDQLMETPRATLLTQFPTLKREGCYSVGAGRYLLVSMDKKDGKPWRVAFTTEVPCKRPEEVAPVEIRQRQGVQLGDTTIMVLEKMGRPDASAAPEAAMKKLGDLEYFYVCRVSDQCARHSSVFIKSGIVTALAEWYSE